MHLTGIITEYNPFHNGHRYHIQKTRQKIKTEGIICIMSGNFVQRGNLSITDKWIRTKMALEGGADLIFELPAAFATRSAEYFALGAVKLLHEIPDLKNISFGSESGSVEPLETTAEILVKNPKVFQQEKDHYLGRGYSYPRAREQALIDYITKYKSFKEKKVQEIKKAVQNPNNILGIEYIKAIKKLKSDIQPITIPRISSGYMDRKIKSNIPSATAVREEIKQMTNKNNTNPISEKVKQGLGESGCLELDRAFKEGRGPVFIQSFSKPLLTLLRHSSPKKLKEMVDVTEGLETRLYEKARKNTDIISFINDVKTKRYTWTRIQRILIYILLNYTDNMAEKFNTVGPQYLRILGFNKKGQEILNNIKEETIIPLITRPSNYKKLPSSTAKEMFELDLKATDIYALGYPRSDIRIAGWDFYRQVVRI